MLSNALKDLGYQTLKKLGLNVNQFKSFINDVYEYCQRFSLTPQDIASNLQTLIKLSKEVSFSRIPDHIEEKKQISRLDVSCLQII